MSDATVLLDAIQQKIGEVSSSTDTATLHLLVRVATIVCQGTTIQLYNNSTEFPSTISTNKLIIFNKDDKKLYFNFGADGWVATNATAP
jgi:hypothetical protein